jgi:hypothetical protein
MDLGELGAITAKDNLQLEFDLNSCNIQKTNKLK